MYTVHRQLGKAKVTQLRWGCVHTSPHGTAPNWSASRGMKRCIWQDVKNYVVRVNRLRETATAGGIWNAWESGELVTV